MSSVVHLVFNSVVVYPTTKKILTSKKRFPSLFHRKILAALFLAFIGFVSLSFEVSQMFSDDNAFRLLGVSRTASDAEIRKAYKVTALELHPDRNAEDPQAEEKFMEFKEAYDKLLNKDFREAYDRWGESGPQWLEKSQDVFLFGTIQIMFTYVVFSAITFITTLSASDTNARIISLTGLMLMAGIEGQLRFQGTDFTMPFFNWLALHQMILLMNRAYYTYVTGVIAFQNLTYVDPSLQTLEHLKRLIQQNIELQRKLLELDQELRITGKQGGLSKKIGGFNSTTANVDVSGAPMSGNSLPRNLQAKNAKMSGHSPPRSRQRIPSWVFMIGMYIFINYVLK
mmetsp:Transcript_7544/g.9845  ORF Transcript_7544/g.9845 Transcript_7544/m.9845 type:complete len:341 (-) Transcript_7544:227-1249(-)